MNPLVAPEAAAHGAPFTALSVNLNKVALLRNTRHLGIPSVTRAATLVLEAGAQGITVHPRPDARHIRAADVRELAELMKQWPHAEYNIEGNPFHNLMEFVREVRPHQATFVPDSVGQFTSDHGWNLLADGDRLAPVIDEARALGVRVSLFRPPSPNASFSTPARTTNSAKCTRVQRLLTSWIRNVSAVLPFNLLPLPATGKTTVSILSIPRGTLISPSKCTGP